jgi:ribosomal subunit interface protein
MEVRIQFQGIEESPWMKVYMEGKLAHLERYLSTGAVIEIDLISQGNQCLSNFSIITTGHKFDLEKEGDDMFEAFTSALNEVTTTLRNEHMKIREKYRHEILDTTEP